VACWVKDSDHLAAYVGVVPTCHSSGEKEHTGEMTFRHNGHLLMMLIESSWTAVREDPAMTLCYSKLVKRMSKNNAIITQLAEISLKKLNNSTLMKLYFADKQHVKKLKFQKVVCVPRINPRAW